MKELQAVILNNENVTFFYVLYMEVVKNFLPSAKSRYEKKSFWLRVKCRFLLHFQSLEPFTVDRSLPSFANFDKIWKIGENR